MTNQLDHLDHAPGGRLDATAQAAHHAGAADVHGHQLAPVDLAGYVLPTRDAMPSETIPRVVTLSAANPWLRILPRDQSRRRAVLLAVDNDVVFVETEDLARQLATQVAGGGAAASLLGAYWPKTVPLTLESRDQMFVVATTQTGSSRVTLFVERYADPPV